MRCMRSHDCESTVAMEPIPNIAICIRCWTRSEGPRTESNGTRFEHGIHGCNLQDLRAVIREGYRRYRMTRNLLDIRVAACHAALCNGSAASTFAARRPCGTREDNRQKTCRRIQGNRQRSASSTAMRWWKSLFPRTERGLSLHAAPTARAACFFRRRMGNRRSGGAPRRLSNS